MSVKTIALDRLKGIDGGPYAITGWSMHDTNHGICYTLELVRVQLIGNVDRSMRITLNMLEPLGSTPLLNVELEGEAS